MSFGFARLLPRFCPLRLLYGEEASRASQMFPGSLPLIAKECHLRSGAASGVQCHMPHVPCPMPVTVLRAFASGCNETLPSSDHLSLSLFLSLSHARTLTHTHTLSRFLFLSTVLSASYSLYPQDTRYHLAFVGMLPQHYGSVCRFIHPPQNPGLGLGTRAQGFFLPFLHCHQS